MFAFIVFTSIGAFATNDHNISPDFVSQNTQTVNLSDNQQSWKLEYQGEAGANFREAIYVEIYSRFSGNNKMYKANIFERRNGSWVCVKTDLFDVKFRDERPYGYAYYEIRYNGVIYQSRELL